MLNLPLAAYATAGSTAKSGLLGKIAGPIAGLAGNIIGGLFGRSGQRDANQANLQMAREQMRFQERMSNTAYQRAAKDLEKAGLNRILALGSPATSPAGARAQFQNEDALVAEGISRGVSSAYDAIKLRQDVKESNARINLVNSQAEQQRALTATERQRVGLVTQQRVNETLRAAGITTENSRKALELAIRRLEIPQVVSLEQFHRWLLQAPKRLNRYYLSQAYGQSIPGILMRYIDAFGGVDAIEEGYTQ